VHAVPVKGVVDVARIDRRNALWRRGVGMAADAAAWLAAHSFCPGIERAFWGAVVPPVFGLFLVEVAAIAGAPVDRWLWVMTGDLPSAYFVVDRGRTAREAIECYCELMADWVAAVREGRSRRGVFPVAAKPTIEHADMLASRIEFLRANLVDSRLAGDVTGAAAPRTPRGARRRVSLRRGLRPGDLATDNLARQGIVVEVCPCPDQAWLRMQRDRRVAAHRSARWWKLLPLSGGAVLVPEPLLEGRGRPTSLQHAVAARNANEHARRTLERLLGAPAF